MVCASQGKNIQCAKYGCTLCLDVKNAFPFGRVSRYSISAPYKVDRGYTAFVGTLRFEYYNPLGTVYGGYTAPQLDSCMACAVHSTLEAGYTYASSEIKINYMRSITSDTGDVRVEGRVINSGKRIAAAEGRLLDCTGKLYAHGTTTCLILPL